MTHRPYRHQGDCNPWSRFLTAHSDDLLGAAGNLVLGSPFYKFLIIAVLRSAAASTQTTILPAARSELSMAVHKALPGWFGVESSWVMGIILLAIGIPIMLWTASRDSSLFKRGINPMDQRPDPDGNGPEPPPIVPGVDASILREA